MFETHELRNMSNTELIALAHDDYALSHNAEMELRSLVNELADRLESLDYMVQATLDRQTDEV